MNSDIDRLADLERKFADLSAGAGQTARELSQISRRLEFEHELELKRSENFRSFSDIAHKSLMIGSGRLNTLFGVATGLGAIASVLCVLAFVYEISKIAELRDLSRRVDYQLTTFDKINGCVPQIFIASRASSRGEWLAASETAEKASKCLKEHLVKQSPEDPTRLTTVSYLATSLLLETESLFRREQFSEAIRTGSEIEKYSELFDIPKDLSKRAHRYLAFSYYSGHGQGEVGLRKAALHFEKSIELITYKNADFSNLSLVRLMLGEYQPAEEAASSFLMDWGNESTNVQVLIAETYRDLSRYLLGSEDAYSRLEGTKEKIRKVASEAVFYFDPEAIENLEKRLKASGRERELKAAFRLGEIRQLLSSKLKEEG